MVGDDSGVRTASCSEGLLLMPRRQQKLAMEAADGRSSPRGKEPSFRMMLSSVCREW